MTRPRKRGAAIVVAALFLLLPRAAGTGGGVDAELESGADDAEYDGAAMGRNPEYYVGPSISSDDGGDSTEEYDTDGGGPSDGESGGDGEEEEEEEGGDGDARSALGGALSKSREGASRSVRFVREHRSAITLALVLFAFRREIMHLLSSLLLERTSDGRRKVRRISVGPTSVLKIILFVDVVRRLRPSSDDEGRTSPLPVAALLGGPGGVVGSLIVELLRPTNTAFVPPIEQHYTFERINERYTKDGLALRKALSPPRSPLVGILGQRGKGGGRGSNADGARRNLTEAIANVGAAPEYNGTVIILDLTALDASLSQMDVMRDEISFLLSQHRADAGGAERSARVNDSNATSNDSANIPDLEIIILLESPGGSASDYGLAADQIGRLRDEPGMKVTVCVDKVAASGGYMMACQSSPGQLYAAPFAVLGSIGVVGQALNIHNTLQGWGMRPLVFRGGKDKAPVGVIGEVTKEGIAKVQSMVDRTHEAFKRHVVKARPGMAGRIDTVATGDVWLGCDALDVGLADRILTSDEYIGERISEGARVLKLIRHAKRFPFISSPSRRNQFVDGGIRSVPRMLSDVRRIISKVAALLEEFSASNDDLVATGATARSALIHQKKGCTL